MDHEHRAPRTRAPADVVAAYREETRALVAARLPIAAAIFLVLMAVGYGIEWLYFPERAVPLLVAYASFLVLGVGGSVAALRHPRLSVEITTVASVALAFAAAAYLAAVHDSDTLTLLTLIGFLTGMVVQFPWGMRGQLAAAVGIFVVYLWALSFGATSSLPVAYGAFALAAHSVMTVVGARVLDEYRFTAFREAADAARHAAESQRANAAKSEFLATVSHELRTPLNIIVGYTDLLLEGTFPQADEREDALGRIHHQSLQLLDLIQSMLDLNRMEATGVALSLEDFTIEELLDEVRSALPASWCKPGVRIVWDTDGVRGRMRSDRGKLAIVLRNLIHNACKYTDDGTVTVSARVDRELRRVLLDVADTGQGIAPQDLSAIFEMFRQGSSGPPRDGGVGLGLYITRRLSDALGGRIEVASEPGRGARFTVSLPLRALDAAPGA